MDRPAPTPQDPVIRMEAVSSGSLQDPATPIVSGVHWQVQPGDFWVIAGLQGAGKTDFLMFTAGLMPPLAGHYWLFGQAMPIFDEARLSERLRLGLVFENGQLLNHLTVRENLALPVRYHQNLTKAEGAAAVQAMLDAMDLGPWADSTPGALGRNWHKRAGMARALMLKPEVLLVDNPLGGLDLRHGSWWLSWLESLTRPGNFVRPEPLTLIVSTADLRPWLGLAGEFAVLKNQQLTVLGDRAQLAAAGKDIVNELLAPQPRDV
jgi:ABC-type transporter Mla maintaining outer membrane lipid asymmetry ATPase subunit MlaF